MWRIEFKPQALDELGKLDAVIAQRILTKTKWFSENIDQITPQPLSGARYVASSNSGLVITESSIRSIRKTCS